MKKILVLLAVEEELGADNIARLSEVADVKCIGVGKLNAYEATMEAMWAKEYDELISVGTCGSFHHPYATLLRPSVVAQGDIYVDSIFASEAEYLPSGDEGISLYSSDNFIGEDSSEATRKIVERYDCMEMEAYAIIRAKRFFARLSSKPEPELHLIKIVSDQADGTIEAWEPRIERLRPKLMEATLELIEKLNNQ